MAGRRPKPRSLRLLTGNAGKRRLPAAEPVPPPGDIVRPAYLKYREVELWDAYAPSLIAMGTLTVVDVPNFAAWCVLMAEFEESKAGMKAADISQMRLLAASLGMDASARTKLAGAGGKGDETPEDEFFRKKNGTKTG